MKTTKPPLFTLESEYPIAGKGESLPLSEWKRIYGYDGKYFPFPAKFTQATIEHAPGPWAYAPEWFAVRYYGEEGEFSHCMGVADVSDDLPDDTRHATGKLIASAPELLKALRDLVAACSAHQFPNIPVQKPIEQAKVVLEKLK